MSYVAMAYDNLGLLKIKELVLQKYPPPTMELKESQRRKIDSFEGL
jgi:hypothetical protein